MGIFWYGSTKIKLGTSFFILEEKKLGKPEPLGKSVSCQLSKIDVVSWAVVPILLCSVWLAGFCDSVCSFFPIILLLQTVEEILEIVLPLARVCRLSALASSVNPVEIDPRRAARKCRCCTLGSDFQLLSEFRDALPTYNLQTHSMNGTALFSLFCQPEPNKGTQINFALDSVSN